MIFRAEWVHDLIKVGAVWDCRPVYRRNGQAMAYKVGAIHPVQPGRFRPHVCHARIESMTPTSVGELRARADETWELPAAWADDLEVQVMVLRFVGRRECCAPFVLKGGDVGADA